MTASPATQRKLPTLMLAALGIVYGDLGTSPLYTYQTIVSDAGASPPAAEALGLLSLVIWSLLIVVSLKYCLVVMRADNHGEGGILALMAVVVGRAGRAAGVLTAMALFGAALIYGDGIITPAISVLSALEGINVLTDSFKPYIMPAALVVLASLFAAQSFGTARIGRVFGPVMFLWFIIIAALGLAQVVREPRVFLALNPLLGLRFLVTHGWQDLTVLGGVFLALTGGEALYADMGHIGRLPIRLSWFALVLPALLLSYAGQTALLLGDPHVTGNPFFRLAPHWAIVPLVVTATIATIIASQAIITGAFSLTRQAMQLGFFPGLRIRQTSDTEYGQIYVPVVNWVMMVLTIALAAGFGSSDRLAGAYGTAVSTTMLLTTTLLYNVMRDTWRWPILPALSVAGLFLVVDLAFFAANLTKIADGGWAPLLLGTLIYLVMTTWRRGTLAVRRSFDSETLSLEEFVQQLERDRIPRVPGTAVFLSRTEASIPPLLVRHVAQMRALQEIVVVMTVRFTDSPRVAAADRATTEQLAAGLWHVTVTFGFIEIPSITAALAAAYEKGCPLDLSDAVYFASRDEVVRCETPPRMPGWRRMLFSVMYRNAVRAADRFDLPRERFLEIARQIAL